MLYRLHQRQGPEAPNPQGRYLSGVSKALGVGAGNGRGALRRGGTWVLGVSGGGEWGSQTLVTVHYSCS